MKNLKKFESLFDEGSVLDSDFQYENYEEVTTVIEEFIRKKYNFLTESMYQAADVVRVMEVAYVKEDGVVEFHLELVMTDDYMFDLNFTKDGSSKVLLRATEFREVHNIEEFERQFDPYMQLFMEFFTSIQTASNEILEAQGKILQAQNASQEKLLATIREFDTL